VHSSDCGAVCMHAAASNVACCCSNYCSATAAAICADDTMCDAIAGTTTATTLIIAACAEVTALKDLITAMTGSTAAVSHTSIKPIAMRHSCALDDSVLAATTAAEHS
jgi:glycine cleavage system regulatory protein